MAGSDDRQSPLPEAAREAALSALATAHAEGQLSSDEYDERLAKALAATEAQQLANLTDDLQTTPATPTVAGRLRSGSNAVRQGTRAWWGDVRTEVAGYPRWLRMTLAAAAVGLTGLVVVLVVDGAVTDESSVVTAQITTGLADFRDVYEEEFGTTVVGRVQIDADHAQVQVPVDDVRPRYLTRYLQGGTFNGDAPARGDRNVRIDLAEIDVAAAERNLVQARASLGVPDPSQVTVILDVPIGAEGPRITFVLRNDYDESARLVTDLAGEVLQRRPFVAPGRG